MAKRRASKSPPARSGRASPRRSVLPSRRRHLAAIFNHDNNTPVDHYTYVICGDGDLMEGISHEAARSPEPSASAS